MATLYKNLDVDVNCIFFLCYKTICRNAIATNASSSEVHQANKVVRVLHRT